MNIIGVYMYYGFMWFGLVLLSVGDVCVTVCK